jgi:hypothetical protein
MRVRADKRLRNVAFEISAQADFGYVFFERLALSNPD